MLGLRRKKRSTWFGIYVVGRREKLLLVVCGSLSEALRKGGERELRKIEKKD